MWRWSTLVFTLWVALPAAGELTIAEAVHRAMSANPRVASSQLDAVSARERAAAIMRRRFGSVDAVASWNSYESSRLLRPMALDLFANPALGMAQLPWAKEQMHYGVAVQVPILDAGKIVEAARTARGAAAGAQASAEETEDEVALSVRTTYRTLLALQHALAAADAYVAALDRDLQDAALRLRVGSWAPVDVDKVRFAAAGAKAEREGINARLQATQALLASLMGEREPAGGYVLVEEEDDPSSKDPVRPVHVRHDLVAAEKLADAAAHREQQAKKAFGPEVGLAFLFQQHRAAGLDPLDTHELDLMVSLPLFDGGARMSALRDARDARLAAEQRVRSKELEIAAQTASAEATVEAERVQLEAGTAQRKLGAEVARVEKMKLDQGVGRMEDYLAARASEVRGETAYWQALYALRNARDDLDYVTGRSLGHE